MCKLISIIIPVRDGESTVEKCLLSIKGLNYPKEKMEVIVIDDGSRDRTPEILKKINDIIVIRTSGIGPSNARNIGIKKAKGNFIAFTDADCMVDKDWINELLKGFKDENIVGVGGNQLSPLDEVSFGRKVQNFLKAMGFLGGYMKSAKDMVKVKHNPLCNSMYRKTVFETVGYFEEHLWPGEDVEFDYRIRKRGLKLVYNPQAIVYHYRTDSLGKFASMIYRYGKSSGGYLTKKLGFYRKLSYEPILLWLYIIAVIALFLYKPWFGLALILVALFGVILFFTVKGKLNNLIPNLMLFLTTIIFWNIGFIRGFFSYETNK